LTETHSPRRIGRSVGALLAGFVAVVVLSLGTDWALHAAGVFPALGQKMSDALFVLATVYRTLYGVVGSYVTARLAPDRPMGHALVGGLNPLALIVTAMPTAWLGGELRVMQLPSNRP